MGLTYNDPMENFRFSEYLKEAINAKGTSVKKLVEETGVQERFINAMLLGQYEKLPPEPYVRGFILRLGDNLGFQAEDIWRAYKRETRPRSSGERDLLPNNRYELRFYRKKYFLALFIIFLFALYALFNINTLLGTPKLTITYPESDNLIVRENSVQIEGKTDAGGKITINGVDVFVDEDGRFEKELSLTAGINIIEVKAKKLLGRETTLTKRIVYEQIHAATSTPTITTKQISPFEDIFPIE